MKLIDLCERAHTGSRQLLYHWTDLHSLLGIIKREVIAYFESDKWDPIKGYDNAKPTSRYISFTRNKNYAIRGHDERGGVRITYDWDILKQFTKTKPVIGPVGKTGGDFHDVLQGAEARFEAEEKVKGPIPLSKKSGLVKIEISKPVHDIILKTIKIQKDTIQENLERAKQARTRQPTKEDYKKAMGANYSEERYLSIKAKGFFDKEDWKPRWWDPEVLEKGVEINKKIIQEYEDLLKLVTVM